MTQEEFYKVKEWVEDVTGCKFDDDHASYDEDGCYFSHYVGEDTISLNINNDRSADLWLLSDDGDIELYATNPENNHICIDIFSHFVYNN